MKKEYASIFSDDLYGFIEYRKKLGLNTHSTEQYLGCFDLYCCLSPPSEPILSKQLVDRWFRDEIDNGYRDMGGRGRAIRQFAKYLNALGKKAYVVPTHLFRTGNTSFAPYILSNKELAAFFNAADQIEAWHCGDKFAPVVAPVIFRLMYTSGLRPQEACELSDNDVNLFNGQIDIRINKRKKERIITVSDDMLFLLNEYARQKEHHFMRSSFFFPRIDGSKYTSQQLGKLCDRCWIMANPDKSPSELPRLRPYDFRHAFATTVLQKWLDEERDLYNMLPYLRSYMGHEHIEDTMYYIHILPDRLIKSPKVNWAAIDSTVPEVSIWD